VTGSARGRPFGPNLASGRFPPNVCVSPGGFSLHIVCHSQTVFRWVFFMDLFDAMLSALTHAWTVHAQQHIHVMSVPDACT
jgi:hypothetical protein